MRYKNLVHTFIVLADENNHSGLVHSMQINKRAPQPNENIRETLMQLHQTDKNLFFKIMKGVETNGKLDFDKVGDTFKEHLPRVRKFKTRKRYSQTTLKNGQRMVVVKKRSTNVG